ncbi:hypothetical protein PDE_00821 [Penicillium oxalicum 114-2]|uniref:Uncharacterized protein n=1 Tax=Penicillium oxalicum (strain 114-2 / CGMCC 5302) TaxID=933388 RepID=S7Z5V8_PENO1|nr:hypothetical protein PDE_00821 [Penicillium oxalicum 114-2]
MEALDKHPRGFNRILSESQHNAMRGQLCANSEVERSEQEWPSKVEAFTTFSSPFDARMGQTRLKRTKKVRLT